MGFRATFDAIEAAAERGDSQSALCLEWINDVIGDAFKRAEPLSLALNGSDPAERVAEALAVWIKESDGRAYADMTATRYSVTSLDTAADGMERLRNQDEFIILASATAESGIDDILAEWLGDLNGCERGDGFNYDAAEHAIRDYVANNLDAIQAELASLEAMERRDAMERGRRYDDSESFTFRLYVRDAFPESA